jgi:hypothetical protein
VSEQVLKKEALDEICRLVTQAILEPEQFLGSEVARPSIYLMSGKWERVRFRTLRFRANVAKEFSIFYDTGVLSESEVKHAIIDAVNSNKGEFIGFQVEPYMSSA